MTPYDCEDASESVLAILTIVKYANRLKNKKICALIRHTYLAPPCEFCGSGSICVYLARILCREIGFSATRFRKTLLSLQKYNLIEYSGVGLLKIDEEAERTPYCTKKIKLSGEVEIITEEDMLKKLRKTRDDLIEANKAEISYYLRLERQHQSLSP